MDDADKLIASRRYPYTAFINPPFNYSKTIKQKINEKLKWDDIIIK